MTEPSPEAIRWAQEQADEIERKPPRYLTPNEEAAFRRRLFTSRSGIPITRRKA
jgi:hypothetical protein